MSLEGQAIVVECRKDELRQDFILSISRTARLTK